MKSWINYQKDSIGETTQYFDKWSAISKFGTSTGDGISTDVFPPGQLANDDDDEGNISSRLTTPSQRSMLSSY